MIFYYFFQNERVVEKTDFGFSRETNETLIGCVIAEILVDFWK